MKIEVAIQCHNFQRRLCWMLSSIYQQEERKKGLGLPEIQVSIAHLKGNGNPATEKVADFFRAIGLRVSLLTYKGLKRFKYRGLTRNDQLKKTGADWIIFADSDMVYPVNFFGELGHLLRTKYRNNPHCLHSQRFSTAKGDEFHLTEDLVNSYHYPCLIPEACAKIAALPGTLMSNIGAGYFQLANVKLVRENHNGLYQPEGERIDYDWGTRGQKAKSDKVFRNTLGKEKISLPVQYHIQHIRDNEAEVTHLEDQR